MTWLKFTLQGANSSCVEGNMWCPGDDFGGNGVEKRPNGC
ncbi:hypothetical protein COLO4_18001 [Corchorus olitorius]|uniref:Uncharacterized protein n=1 Tax=Corchorus olitorius TaxID=93759 RepID=A0A1R3JAW3_9ROSI|nr:hypothetical protein COLO4_18001 [Corchorus olitorius]